MVPSYLKHDNFPNNSVVTVDVNDVVPVVVWEEVAVLVTVVVLGGVVTVDVSVDEAELVAVVVSVV